MIPKIIHYCWFGRAPKPEIVESCIASWRRFCPGWELREWNEDNWDLERFPYAQDAYASKNWALVSDVARLDILDRFGGVYLDTDVEILRENPFEPYLRFGAVLSFETERGINTGQFFACRQGGDLCRRLLLPYSQVSYSPDTVLVNTRMNEPVIRELLPDLKWNGKTQRFGDDAFLILGYEEYGRIMKHYGMRSWCENLPDWKVSKDSRLKRFLRRPETFEKFENSALGRKLLPAYTFLSYDLLDLGPGFYLKLLYNKRIRPKLTKRD